MFERPHHQRILQALRNLDGKLLAEANCFFGGGTAIVLALGEYRESVDIDFLCADRHGYRLLRSALAMPTLGKIATGPIEYVREVRTERDKIFTRILVDQMPIKLEFVLEGRIDLQGQVDPTLGVPVLARDDMYAEKLLATADRGLDASTMGRDLIDLAMMIDGWGAVPAVAWEKTEVAYGSAIRQSVGKARDFLLSGDRLARFMRTMQMDAAVEDRIREALATVP